VVEVPKRLNPHLSTVSFRVYEDGIETSSPGLDVVERFVEELDRVLRRPYAGLATRQTEERWAVAGKEFKSDSIRLARRLPAARIELAISPEGERSVLVDGEPVGEAIPASIMEALAELEERGRERFEAFVARADRRNDDDWEVTIDPL
jgi:hypothetical protein